jgi:SAM-dependent methyltransferase
MTTDQIDQNLLMTGTADVIDQINAEFYGRFPFPWRPSILVCGSDHDFARIMLNQNLGDWDHKLIPQNPRIWIAGCGRNQAVITALEFPDSEILGSDISGPSLDACTAMAQELAVSNLELRQESLNGTRYRERFDYIICTGVIHHNADPEASLKHLAQALKPAGVLELMVYNRYHRLETSAFQKALRLLAGTTGKKTNYDEELSITRALIEQYPVEGLMSKVLHTLKGSPDEQLADTLMQPVEHSYTVESLEQMAAQCGLELLLPCLSPWDKASGTLSWNLRFPRNEIQKMYDELPDSRRWQITNLLMFEKSPFLWFYLKRKDSPLPRRSEFQIGESFLQRCFVPAVTRRRVYVPDENGIFKLISDQPYPGPPASEDLCPIVHSADGKTPLIGILKALGRKLDFATVNDLRLQLTTSLFPYLMSIPAAE